MAHSSYDPSGTRIAAAAGAAAGQASILTEPRFPSRSAGGKRVLLMPPGHGGTASSFVQAGTSFTQYLQPLADAGYSLLGADFGGPSTWGNAAAMSAYNDAYSWATTVYGARARVGVLTWSMGGGTSLNWMRRNPAKVAGMFTFAALTDVAYFGTAGYAAPYTYPTGAQPGNYASEVSAAYPAGHSGYSPWEDYALYRGLGVPVRMAHAQDDTTVPYNATVQWLANVNDPRYTLRTVATGGHTGLFAGVPVREVIDFFDSLTW